MQTPFASNVFSPLRRDHLGALALAAAMAAGLAACGESGNGMASTARVDSEHLSSKTYDLDFGREGDVVIGAEDAPVEIVEYASTTCGHCAAFHVEVANLPRDVQTPVFPKLKEKYIETGLVKYTIREFPTPPAALAIQAFMLAECLPEDRYYPFLDVLFRTQKNWAQVTSFEEGRARLTAIAQQSSLTPDRINACLTNDASFQAIQAQTAEGTEKFDVRGTPTVFINGRKLDGLAYADRRTGLPGPDGFRRFEEIILPFIPEDRRPEPEPAPAEGADTETAS